MVRDHRLHQGTRRDEMLRVPRVPLGTLERFSGEPIINGGCHHADGIPNNRRMAVIGVDAWIEEQIGRYTCPKCGELRKWFNVVGHVCKK